MKRNKFAIALLVILTIWSPYFLGAFDKDKPASSTSLRNSNPEILANWDALEIAIGADHEFSTGGTNSGEHKQVKFNAPIATPTNAANKSFLYEKDVAAVVELHWLDESGNELQFTSTGDLFSSTGLTVTNNATFNGGITLGDGDDLIGSATSDITINTDKFTVAGDTGNTVVAGTLAVTGVATLGDGSTLATSAAPTADAEIANKKYVDDQIQAHTNFGAWETNPSGFATSVTALTDGFVCAYVTGANKIISGYTPIATLRTSNKEFSTDPATGSSITMPVRKGDTWKVVGATTVFWLPIGQ